MEEVKTTKVYKCKKCGEDNPNKFYIGRYGICKLCYTRQIVESKTKQKSKYEELQSEIKELKDKLEAFMNKSE
jgi:DNA-directed RNA polymerase subunit RPC12/RpoP